MSVALVNSTRILKKEKQLNNLVVVQLPQADADGKG